MESVPLVHRYIYNMMVWHKITGFIGAVLLAYGSLMLGGCAESDSYAVIEGYEAGRTETSTAKLEISGMMCANACGGKIKKELLEIPGVANAAIDFESGRDLHAAEVEFDPKAVTPDQVTHFAKEASLSQ